MRTLALVQLLDSKLILAAPLALVVFFLVGKPAADFACDSVCDASPLVLNSYSGDLVLDLQKGPNVLEESESLVAGSLPHKRRTVVGILNAPFLSDHAATELLFQQFDYLSFGVVDVDLKHEVGLVDDNGSFAIEEACGPYQELSFARVHEVGTFAVASLFAHEPILSQNSGMRNIKERVVDGGKPPINVVDVETGIMMQLGGTYEALDWMRR